MVRTTTDTRLVVEGRVTQKRKRVAWLVLTLDLCCHRDTPTTGPTSASLDPTPPHHQMTVYVPRRPAEDISKDNNGSSSSRSSSNSNNNNNDDTFSPLLFYLQSVIRVSGEWVTCLESYNSPNNSNNNNSGCCRRPTNLEPTSTPHSEQQQPIPVPPLKLRPGHWFVAQTIELLQCAPDPQAVQAVMASMILTRTARHTTGTGTGSTAATTDTGTGSTTGRPFALSTLVPRSLYAQEISITACGTQRQKAAEERIQSLLHSLCDDDTTAAPIPSALKSATSPALVYATIVHALTMTTTTTGDGNNTSLNDVATSERRPPRCRVRRIAPSDLHVLECAELALHAQMPLIRRTGCAALGPDLSLGTATQPNRRVSNPSKDRLQENDHCWSTDDIGVTESFHTTTTPTAAPIMSSRGHQSRHEYWTTKKVPQVNWMVNRIANVMKMMMPTDCPGQPPAAAAAAAAAAVAASVHHVLDIGGGRGDLAWALAHRFPDLTITVVDRNATSVAAGQARAASRDTENSTHRRVHFIVADFEAYASHPARYYTPTDTTNTDATLPIPPVDLVVALHACGDLSDAALHHATHTLHCSFVICPCCYTKRYLHQSFWGKSHPFEYLRMIPPVLEPSDDHLPNDPIPANHSRSEQCRAESFVTPHSGASSTLSTLLRLAELNEHPDVCHRAAIVINTARLQRCHATNPNDSDQRETSCLSRTKFPILQLEEFPSEYSKRNLVLVGIARSNPTL